MNCVKYILIPFILLFVACGSGKKEEQQKTNAENNGNTENQQKDAESPKKSVKFKIEKKSLKAKVTA